MHFSPRPNRAHEIAWRPWGPEAFAAAREADRPILLSISAVWCHWCHVMDETTYSDEAVIAAINAEYVPVRVDNDERPDVNARYNMGGWPTTAFLTPQGDILAGATYLPPDQMAAALRQVRAAYRTQKPEIVARVLEQKKRLGLAHQEGAGEVGAVQVDDVLGWLERAYDPEHGGFGSAPKFPMTDALALLAEQAALRGEPRYLEMARHTLARMAGGGTYDHVEDGFFRYSTTPDWSVPHFEKMLEDHAGLVQALALTGQSEILDGACRFLDAVLRDPSTGLYGGSQDADEEYYARDLAGRRGLAAPYVDRRAYAGWNAALATAYLEADRRLGRAALRDRARALLERLFAERLTPDGGLDHLPGEDGLLGDQAHGLLAAVRAYQAGLGEAWLERAHLLAAGLERFRDPEAAGYLDTARDERLGRLEEPVKPLAENAAAAMGLLELDALEGEPEGPLRARARSALESVSGLVRQHGIMAAAYARAADRLLREPVKVTTSNPDLVRAALEANPAAVVEPGDERLAVACVGTVCLAPTTDAGAVREAVTNGARRTNLPPVT